MAETAEGVDYSSLKESLFKNLEQRGVVEKLKAIVRSELYDEINDTPASEMEEPPRETIVLNNLFREYLLFNGYTNTLSVFLKESGQSPDSTLPRDYLAKEFGLTDGSPPTSNEGVQIPLMYTIIEGYGQVQKLQQTLAPLVRLHEENIVKR